MRLSLKQKFISWLFFVILLCGYCAAGSAESPTEEIPQPTLSPDAAPYDAEHPENLEADQLYGLSAILLSEDTGEIIFEKVDEAAGNGVYRVVSVDL